MTATYQIPSTALNLQFIQDLQEKYGEAAQLEIRVHKDSRPQILSEAHFWSIIDRLDWSKLGDNDAVVASAVAYLASLPVGFIYQFEDLLSEKLHQLDTRQHAAKSTEPFSVDEFLYQRCAVVANGKTVFNTVLKDPSQMPNEVDFEPLLYIAADAYTLKTGKTFDYLPTYSVETFANKTGWQ
jgi:hypothetical protein